MDLLALALILILIPVIPAVAITLMFIVAHVGYEIIHKIRRF